MSDKVKNYLGITLIGALIIVAIVSLNIASVYSESASQRSFVVSAQGKSVVIPDIAQFTYGIITEGGKDIATLQQHNTNQTNKINDYLTSKGINKKDIQTQYYNVQPRYQYSAIPSCNPGGICPPPEIVGYSISQTLLVKVREVSKAGDLLSGVVNNGANSVSQLSFTVDDPTTFQTEARKQAIQKAQEKAHSIAQAGKFTLGKLLSINEASDETYPYSSYDVGSMEAGGKGGAAPMIEPGSQEVFVNVTLTYEIR